jgi:cyclase
VTHPDLINRLSNEFGSQCVVVAIDTKCYPEGDRVHIHGGRTPTDKATMEWSKEAQERGAGEILLTSMDHDGTKNGFAIDLTARISGSLSIPVIASGGAGTMDHFYHIFSEGKADAALAASIFHYREIGINELKKYLANLGMPVRL